MILCGDKTGVGGGGVLEGGGCTPWKGIGRPEERAGWFKNKNVTLNDGA